MIEFENDAAELIELLAPSLESEQRNAILRESHGHPLFIHSVWYAGGSLGNPAMRSRSKLNAMSLRDLLDAEDCRCSLLEVAHLAVYRDVDAFFFSDLFDGEGF